MSDRRKPSLVRGVDVSPVALDVVAWREAGKYWRYEFFGRALWREGELLAEGVATIRDAVLWAKAWESCLAHARKLRRMPTDKFNAYLERTFERAEAHKLQERDHVISEQSRLADGPPAKGDSGSAPEADSRP